MPSSSSADISLCCALLLCTVSLHGVGFFPAQDLEADDLAKIALLLGEAAGKPTESGLHIHPTQFLGENGLPVGQITNVADKDGRQISFADERSTFASAGWHSGELTFRSLFLSPTDF